MVGWIQDAEYSYMESWQYLFAFCLCLRTFSFEYTPRGDDNSFAHHTTGVNWQIVSSMKQNSTFGLWQRFSEASKQSIP